MDGLGASIAGFVLGALALLGLILASHAVDGAFAAFGWGFIIFGVAGIFVLIHRFSGRP
jgi:hypothetical protein